MKTRHKIILTAIGLGLLTWLLDALLDYLIFYPGSFWGLVITEVPTHEVYIRLFILGCFVAFGLIASQTISAREEAEQVSRRANRALRMLSDTNQTLIRADDEERLLRDVCAIVVDEGGYKLARVAFADEEVPTTIRPVEEATRDEALLDKRILEWTDTEQGESPAVAAIRTGQPVLYEDLAAEHPRASRRSRRTGAAGSLIVLPLTARGRTLGVLGVYASRPRDVSQFEINLLSELAADLAYGVLSLREQENRRRAEQALQESEARYRHLFNGIQAGVVVHDADGQIQMTNEKAVELLGLAPAELTRRGSTDPSWDFLRGDGTPMPVEDYPVNQVLATGQPVRDFIVGVRRPDAGDLVWLSVRADPVFAADEELNRVVVTFMDITARKEVQEELRKTKTLLDTAGKLAGVGGWEVIPDTEKVRWTDETRRIHGVPPDYEPDLEEAINFFHPDDRERLTNAIQRALDHGEPYDLEVRLITASGDLRWTRTLCRPQVVDGQTIKLLGAFQDITERKRTERAVVAQRDRAQQYLDVASVMIVALDATGQVTLINPKGCQVLGYEEEELLGRDWFEMAIPERNRDHVREVFKRLMAGEVEQAERAENPIITRNGKERIIAWHNALLTDESGDPVGTLSSGTDITEQQKAEEALVQYTQRLETLREMDQAILAARSPAEIADAALARIRRLVPCTAGAVGLYDFDGHSVHILAIHSNEELPLERGASLPLEGLEDAVDAGRRGEIFVEPDLLALPDPPPALRVIRSLEIRSYVGVPLLARGNLIGTLALAAEAPQAFGDEQVSVVEEVADQLAIAVRQARLHAEIERYAKELEDRVAERTRQLRERMAEAEDLNQTLKTTLEELRVANEQLDQSARQLEATNAELEAFAYSVSHDLRAPLRAIHGFAQIIARRHRDDLNEEGRHYFDNIVEAGEHMGQLIDDLLRYSRLGRQELRYEQVPLAAVLARVRSNLEDRITTEGGKLIIPDELPIIYSSRTLLNQIFTNLIDNALTYHRPGVPPRVEVRCESHPDSIVLSVADNGIGIPSEFHDKVFRIFQRLQSQEDYPGTGIGLSIVKKAAERLGGTVWFESVEGEGSTFYVELPVGSDQRSLSKGEHADQ